MATDDPKKILAEVTKAKPRGYSSYENGLEKDRTAYSVVLDSEKRADAVIAKLRKRLPAGWVAFAGTIRRVGVKGRRVEVVVAPGADQFDIVRIARTEPVNFGLETKDVIATLKAWDAKYGIDIVQASTDTVGLWFAKMGNVDKLARVIKKFCPDVVVQGFGSLAELAKYLRKESGVSLWWD
jgi:hypothetical protein